MLDSSDGLARSLHQIAAASGCGFAVRYGDLPVDDAVREVAGDAGEERGLATAFGEDFELVCTLPEKQVADARAACPVELSVVGEVTEDGVRLDGEPLADRGYTH
jgi:thiamine-monophosphate kinase